jgi:hypothetical protein
MQWGYLDPLAVPAVAGALARAITVYLRERTKRRKIDRAYDAYQLTLEQGHPPSLVDLTKALGEESPSAGALPLPGHDSGA